MAILPSETASCSVYVIQMSKNLQESFVELILFLIFEENNHFLGGTLAKNSYLCASVGEKSDGTKGI